MISTLQTASLVLGISGIALMIKAIVNYKAYQRGVMTKEQIVNDFIFTIIVVGVMLIILSAIMKGQ